jgi:RNA polymerase sigma-70 factor (ECF subfamily)
MEVAGPAPTGPRRERPDVEAEAILALDRADHRSALEVLMRGYGTDVYRYCRRMLSEPERAKDVLQNTFVQAYEGLPRFERRSSLRSWLFGIARHRCLDDAKLWRRWRLRVEAVETLPEPPSPERTAVDGIQERQAKAVLERCLHELTARVRDAVLLRYVEGYPYTEMSEICNERPATLQARVVRALPLLRRCLERSGFKR